MYSAKGVSKCAHTDATIAQFGLTFASSLHVGKLVRIRNHISSLAAASDDDKRSAEFDGRERCAQTVGTALVAALDAEMFATAIGKPG